MKLLRFMFICLFVVFTAVVFFPLNAASKNIKELYYKFDRFASNFDPIGKALQPVNDIPQLKISGVLYNWAFFNVHSDDQVAYTNKDWRIQQMQFLGEIQTRYQFASRSALVNKIHYHYDAVYDWQKSSLYADHVNKNAERTNTWDQFIREFYMDKEYGNWVMKFGKQQVVWGKMEGRWMDFINNVDSKDGLQVRSFYYNELRIPLWMSNITYSFGENSVQFLWIPDFEPELNPYPGSPWWSPLLRDPRSSALYRGVAKEPGNSFDDHQWALRFDTKFDRVTWTLGYMYGFAPTAVNFINNDVVGQPYYSPEFKRRHYIGSALDFAYLIKPFPIFKKLPTVIRAEVVYKTDNYFLDAEKWDSTNKILKSGNGYTDSDLLSGAIQFMFFFPYRCSITYQPMLNYYFGWKESFGVNHWGLSHLFLLSKFFKTFENRLILSIYTFLNTGGPVNEWLGTKSQIVFSWKFSDYIEGKLHYIDYQGSLKDPYGQYDSWDNAGWEIVYKF